MIVSLLVIQQQFMRLSVDHDIFAPMSAHAVMMTAMMKLRPVLVN